MGHGFIHSFPDWWEKTSRRELPFYSYFFKWNEVYNYIKKRVSGCTLFPADLVCCKHQGWSTVAFIFNRFLNDITLLHQFSRTSASVFWLWTGEGSFIHSYIHFSIVNNSLFRHDELSVFSILWKSCIRSRLFINAYLQIQIVFSFKIRYIRTDSEIGVTRCSHSDSH